MTDNYHSSSHAAQEEMVNLFLDGELPIELQARVFSHLADCDQCRTLIHRVMGFRQVSRQEYLHVAPAVDVEFFRKLESHKLQATRLDRSLDRRPLWQRRRLVSLRTAIVLAAIFICLGLFMPAGQKEVGSRLLVHGETESVEFRDVIYVIYPGLTVEATRL